MSPFIFYPLTLDALQLFLYCSRETPPTSILERAPQYLQGWKPDRGSTSYLSSLLLWLPAQTGTSAMASGQMLCFAQYRQFCTEQPRNHLKIKIRHYLPVQNPYMASKVFRIKCIFFLFFFFFRQGLTVQPQLTQNSLCVLHSLSLAQNSASGYQQIFYCGLHPEGLHPTSSHDHEYRRFHFKAFMLNSSPDFPRSSLSTVISGSLSLLQLLACHPRA